MQTGRSWSSGIPIWKQVFSALKTHLESFLTFMVVLKNIVQHQVTGLPHDIATTLTPLFHILLDFSLHVHTNVSCYNITSETRWQWEHSEARKQNSSFMSWQKAEPIVRPCSEARTQQQLRGTVVKEYLCSVLLGVSGLQREGELGSDDVKICSAFSSPCSVIPSKTKLTWAHALESFHSVQHPHTHTNTNVLKYC